MIRLSASAGAALRPDEVVLVDWHRTGLCCSETGEFSVRAVHKARLPRRAQPAPCTPRDLVFAHPVALGHLLGRDVTVECRFLGPWRRFVTDLPPDAGLRACLGRLPEPVPAARPEPGRSP